MLLLCSVAKTRQIELIDHRPFINLYHHRICWYLAVYLPSSALPIRDMFTFPRGVDSSTNNVYISGANEISLSKGEHNLVVE